jgi:hypothetical protein
VNSQITLTEDFNDSRSSKEDMPYPDSDSDTIPMNTSKNQKKRKLQNQYPLLSDDEDDDSTATSTDSSTTSLNVRILHKTTSTNKKKTKNKTTFNYNCNQEQEECLSMKQDPQQVCSFLSHPATYRQNIHDSKANIKQATKERNSGTDNVTYGAALSSSRKNKLRSSPLQLRKSLTPTKQKTQSTVFPFVFKKKSKPHQHRQLFADNNNTDDADSLWSHEPQPPHNTFAPNSSENTHDNPNRDRHNNTKNEEKTSLPPSNTQ